MQIGGLGYATFAVLLLVMLRQKVAFSQRNLAKEALNLETGRGIVGLVKLVIGSSLILESAGTLLLFIVFRPHFATARQALGMGVFHAISAFNNAGLDLLGNSFSDYHDNVLLNLTITTLIVCGGIGFFVISDVLSAKKWRRFAFHTKVVLSFSFALILIGTVLLRLCCPISTLEAFFLSVTSRTAGFNTVDTAAIGTKGLIITIVLMFIGASPGSTGGGIKTTTFFTVLVALRAIATGHEPSAFCRKITTDSILKAFTVITFSLLVLVLAIFGISAFEGTRFSLLSLVFEAISAFATVGLSCGVTGSLGIPSKFILMLLMFIGRIGPLTIASSLNSKERHLHYVEEHIIIG